SSAVLARTAICFALVLAFGSCKRHSTAAAPDAGASVSPPSGAANLQGSGVGASGGTTSKSIDGGGTVTLAHKAWPACMHGTSTVAVLDEDAGVSPYDDTCLIDEQHGVFTDPVHGDDTTGDGSRDLPFGTLQAAIGTAVNAGKRVYACVGKYQGPVAIGTAISNGLGVYGGLSCDTFQPDTTGARTSVEVLSGGPALLIADTSDVEVARIDFAATPSDHAPGTSYLAASIGNSHRISLIDVALRAAPGEPGADGAAPAAAPKAGAQGGDGADACAASGNLGALVVVNDACTMQSTVGGAGGDGGLGTGNGGSGTFGAGGGGVGEMSTGWACDTSTGGVGQPGFMGYPGSYGVGAKGFGALVGGRFTGFSGQPGQQGGTGYGGAGGGGAKAPHSGRGLAIAAGASGGGGGAGGCGGKGGKGGAAGGSSFGLVLVDSNVRMLGGSIAYGDGGKGGDGAEGQPGGKGGAGGKGGKGTGGSHDACDGTAGGDGAAGGPGGGGNGGHAIGVLYLYLGKAPVLSGVTGATDAATRKGGSPGIGAASMDPNAAMPMMGTPGVAEFTHAM
ncbi:MAG: hypothetical protein ACHQ53_06450, partial [Polyangiales bacterium]